MRSGIDQTSGAPLAPSQMAQLWQTSPALDGKVYGQPLVYGSTVYVASENDTVYALDAGTGAVIWQHHLATPVPSGDLSCGDISPTVGITSTPVLDPATGRIFVVADTLSGSTIQHELFGLNLSDGSLSAGLPMVVDPAGTTPKDQLQRAGLALDGGKVIIGLGGNDGDCGSYHGWLVAAPEGGGALQSFEVDASGSQGAIWGSGNAPPVDSTGEVWTSTGNGNSSSFDYQESVLKLDSNMSLLDHWAPSNWASLDSSDTDLGSTMPLLLPAGLVFQIGKQGVGYLLNAADLGGTGGAPVYQATVCNGSWGGGIYYNGVIYVTCASGMHALALNTSARTFSALSGWTVNSNAVGPPIEAGGLIWSAGWNDGVLYGLDPATGATSFSKSLATFEHFTSPSAAGGHLYVANGSSVTAFNVAQPSAATATTTSLGASPDPAPVGAGVTLTATISPAPDGGTVAFSDDGAAITGCGVVPVSAGRASCTTAFSQSGSHSLLATYSGDLSYAPSSSSAVSETVTAPPSARPHSPPRISRLRVVVRHGRIIVRLVLSEKATLTFTIALRGHRRKVRLARHGSRGSDRFGLRIKRLRPGRYRLNVVATDSTGLRSKRVWANFAVHARRH